MELVVGIGLYVASVAAFAAIAFRVDVGPIARGVLTVWSQPVIGVLLAVLKIRQRLQ